MTVLWGNRIIQAALFIPLGDPSWLQVKVSFPPYCQDR
jgi:hypothetical protein